VILLDAYAVIALLTGEPAAPAVWRLLDSDQRPAVTTTGIIEVLDRLIRRFGVVEREAVNTLGRLRLESIMLTDEIATGAGLLRARHYRRTGRSVSLADCVAAETARAIDVPLATAAPGLIAMCEDEGIGLVRLRAAS
jgi:uncharacterized protein with PIN domain